MGAGDAFLAPEERLQAGSRARTGRPWLCETQRKTGYFRNINMLEGLNMEKNHEVLIIYIYIYTVYIYIDR